MSVITRIYVTAMNLVVVVKYWKNAGSNVCSYKKYLLGDKGNKKTVKRYEFRRNWEDIIGVDVLES